MKTEPKATEPVKATAREQADVAGMLADIQSRNAAGAVRHLILISYEADSAPAYRVEMSDSLSLGEALGAIDGAGELLTKKALQTPAHQLAGMGRGPNTPA